MKKAYINPSLRIRKVVINNIIMASPGLESGDAQSTYTPATGGNGNGLAKWGDCWTEESDIDQ